MMLEKIGLPAKPSMRGANWVIDASHCQGCSSPFTFLNRKHHCRRCGGIFCNSCTQQRMVLRGQGDSPVRICEPCKKLEEAARFEQRYGHKNRVSKGGSKQIQKTEDELLGEILGTDGKHLTPSRKGLHLVSDLPRTEGSSSIVSYNSGGEGDCSNSVEGHNNALIDIGNTSPEDLRQKAVEEKRRYRILKAEGKAEEALKAFKHGKELERQAEALEIVIRKNRRMAAKVSYLSSRVSTDGMDDHEALSSKKKSTSSMDKEVKGDLFTELRELGWADADLHDADKKPAKLSLEGELSNLLGDTSHKSEIVRKKGGIDKTQVGAHKRKALLLKREGKLAEAKEELKQAKILEKQLEEQEFLAEASDSEDELSTVINSMEDDNQDGLLLDNALDVGANFGHLLDATGDLPIDSNLEVTDNDMNDPELAAALKSFGWTEHDEHHELNHAAESVPSSQEALQAEVLHLKKEALSQKRSGNLPEAVALLKKAKLLEQNLESIQPEAPGFAKMSGDNQISASKSKMVIQKELLALKKKALALRREGRVEEAEEELKKGKFLEQQLEEFQNASTKPATRSDQMRVEPTYVQDGDPGNLDLGVDESETNVTDQDMHDPAMLSDLKNLGWNDDVLSDPLSTTSFASKPSNSHCVHESVPSVMPWKSLRNKAEIQRELLAIKRKALALRRQGKAEEAEEELERAKDLEKQMQELESQTSGSLIQQEKPNIRISEENVRSALEADGLQRHVSSRIETIKVDDTAKPPERLPTTLGSSEQSLETCKSEFEVPKIPVNVSEVDPAIGNGTKENADNNERISHKQENSKSINNKSNGINGYKEEILAHKRNALALKKKGKLTEAKEELRKAKLLEMSLEEGQENSIDVKPAIVSTHESTSVVLENRRAQSQKPVSGRDRFKLQQESLAHKRNALKLWREGKVQESEAEFQNAKELENQLEELAASGSSSSGASKDVIVDDLLDPQLMSALKSIGWNDNDMMAKPQKPESQSVTEKIVNQSRLDRTHLQEQIKAEKLRALNLKRSGNQDEALEALRAAKKLEKKLASLT